MQQGGYKPVDPFGSGKKIDKITVGGVNGSLPPVTVQKGGVTYGPPKQIPNDDPNKVTGIPIIDDFWRDWLKPAGETVIGMQTDPVGSVGVAEDFYSDKLKELTGFSLDDIGIYALVFVLLLIGVLGLLLPGMKEAAKQVPIVVA